VVSIWSLGTDGGRGGDSGALVWFFDPFEEGSGICAGIRSAAVVEMAVWWPFTSRVTKNLCRWSFHERNSCFLVSYT